MTPTVVFVSIPSGASAGNVLRTGIVRRLLDADSSVNVVIISPMVNDAAFVREFERPRVRFEDLPPHVPSGLEARLIALIQAGYLSSGATESVKIRREEAMRKKSVRWIGLKSMLAGLVAPSIKRPPTRYELVDRLVSHPWAERLFDRDHPALLVAASPGLILSEVPLLRTAVQRKVRTIVVDASWDNFTNKLVPVRRADRLIVWNDIMKEQATGIHGYSAGDVRVAGPPHWDLYFRPATVATRDAFFRRVGADPARRLITVTTTPAELYSHFDHVIRVLLGAMDQGRWPSPAQLLVRLHPRDELHRYAEFRDHPQVILEKPFRSTVRAGDGLAVDITTENQQHLADTLRHSDVVVTVASTIAVEASIVDTPVVNVSFDGEAPSEWVRSARRYYRFTHFVNVTRHGAAPVAPTPDELIALVGRYLADRTLDREGRRLVMLDQCQFVDGRSSERLADFVVEELADVCGWSCERPLEGREDGVPGPARRARA